MTVYKRKSTTSKLSNRKPWQRLDDAQKNQIIREVQNGFIGIREAGRKYKVHRAMIQRWLEKTTINSLIEDKVKPVINNLHSDMNVGKVNQELLSKVRALTKELQYSKLKIEGLETMIIVAEEDLKISIRKKRGTKQLKECDKVNPQ